MRPFLDAALEAEKPALFLDFDGTLVSIAPRPESVRMTAGRRESLRRLAALIPVAIVSGRTLIELDRLLGAHGLILAGNHGLEIRTRSGLWIHPRAAKTRPCLKRVLARAAPALAAIPGAFIEDKGLTVSLHFRLARPGSGGRIAGLAAAAVAGLERRLEIRTGKKVVEIRPRVDWDKGRAVRRIQGDLEDGSTPIYIGDDRTDEDAFRALAGRGLTARVGGRGPTAAGFQLAGVGEVWIVIRALLRKYAGTGRR